MFIYIYKIKYLIKKYFLYYIFGSFMFPNPFYVSKNFLKICEIITKKLDYKPETFKFIFICIVTVLILNSNFVYTIFICAFSQS